MTPRTQRLRAATVAALTALLAAGTATLPAQAHDAPAPAGGPRLGEDTAIHADSRYDAKGAADGVAVSVWHLAVPVDSARTADSITLPDDARLEVYALSGRDV